MCVHWQATVLNGDRSLFQIGLERHRLHDLLGLKEVGTGSPIRLHKAIDAEIQIRRGALGTEVTAKGPDLLAVLLSLEALVHPVPNEASLQNLKTSELRDFIEADQVSIKTS